MSARYIFESSNSDKFSDNLNFSMILPSDDPNEQDFHHINSKRHSKHILATDKPCKVPIPQVTIKTNAFTNEQQTDHYKTSWDTIQRLLTQYKSSPLQKFCTCNMTENNASLLNKVMTMNNLEYIYKLTSYEYKMKEKRSPITCR
ncbi:unnamed protein product [Moneuplotes crassus]|uniref:Uncharacterized protein n=1 Tax=Euplotes crassus TaxID=5936 RepID=A0AAD1Y8R8_EUPCR|nr:unnamed protein product [Moneuplotes crassus]